MGFQEHFELMSLYNKRLNNQVYSISSKLSYEELTEDKGAFFKSVLGTLNHILVGDLIWLSRFQMFSDEYKSLNKISNYPLPQKLNDILYTDFQELRSVRNEVDEIIINWLSNDTQENDFEEYLKYKNTKGMDFSKKLGEVISHFFNHQTHHRGQVSTILFQLGHDIGVTDFAVDIPNYL